MSTIDRAQLSETLEEELRHPHAQVRELVRQPTRRLALAPGALPASRALTVKHGIDRVVALLLVLLLVPVLVVLAVAVKASSPGPVLYRQRRIGRDGRAFAILKFRSMRVHTHARFALASGSAPGGVEGVDRRTAVGRLMRRTSLDELPQLLNVLRGDMSLVGPRPERPEFVQLFADEVPGYVAAPPHARRHHGPGPGPRPARADEHRGPGGRRQRVHRRSGASCST